MGIKIKAFLTLALDGGGWSSLRIGRLNPGGRVPNLIPRTRSLETKMWRSKKFLRTVLQT